MKISEKINTIRQKEGKLPFMVFWRVYIKAITVGSNKEATGKL
jgi:hypothetical protein